MRRFDPGWMLLRRAVRRMRLREKAGRRIEVAVSVGSESIRIEVSAATLGRLLADGHLGAADLRCLDCASKRCVWRLCLASCVQGRAACAECPRTGCPIRDAGMWQGQ